ncbi:MAG: Na(+)/H(+) antiporter subunit B [Bdellovibrionales bacterium GWC1_52_8]|nr:MAG: Na(+)/H(+) antiporter subunit B [Bdellovibrionales bacterium GWB1_52_6]OFZ03847.1 MAG: Na(+)/H(+) antiporter subunit B [Bdellovibrionales bacterium GWA1_52_35]OFZ38666.1 MAG: Na(+)/H(+) antiporter subunit B [Bdellovibrionales bacterium GWC1_52_8]HCM39718.1 Na+/H+ antiporter subunit B [Bdellovibrionales bacterium]
MTTLILRTTARLLITLLLLFSIFLLLRGHDNPGGGFTGGLVAAAAWTLYTIAYGTKLSRHALRVNPRSLTAAGLATGLSSGLVSSFAAQPLFTGLWFELRIGSRDILHLGTPLLFDIGVYMVVLGTALTIIFAFEEEQ